MILHDAACAESGSPVRMSCHHICQHQSHPKPSTSTAEHTHRSCQQAWQPNRELMQAATTTSCMPRKHTCLRECGEAGWQEAWTHAPHACFTCSKDQLPLQMAGFVLSGWCAAGLRSTQRQALGTPPHPGTAMACAANERGMLPWPNAMPHGEVHDLLACLAVCRSPV